MKRQRKIIKPMIVALGLALVITACGGKSSTPDTSATASQSAAPAGESGSSAKPAEELPLYTIKYFLNGNVKTSEETRIGKYIKDKFNIVFEYIPFSGDYTEKLNLMLSAGDYPDMLQIQGEPIFQKYLQAGALVSLDDYLNDAPNFQERYKEQIPIWRLSSPDHKLFKWESFVPQSKEVNVQNYDIMVRTDALEKQGWPSLRSTDDYIKFLKQAVIDFPTTNGKKTVGLVAPFGEPWGVPGIMGALNEKGDTYDSAAGNGSVIWNIKTKQYESYMHNPYYKESLQFFNKLYQAGLLDKESFTDHLDQFNIKMESGQTLSGWYALWEQSPANTKLIAAGHPEQQYITLPIQTNTMAQQNQKRQMFLEADRPFNNVAITKNAKYPDRIFKLIEWAASEEGQTVLQSGIEGTDYVIKDGKRAPSDAFIKYLKGEDPKYQEQAGLHMFDWLGTAATLGKDGVAYELAKDPLIKDMYGLTDRQKEAFNRMGWKTSTEWWTTNGFDAPEGLASTVSIDPATDLGKLNQKLIEYRTKESAKVVLAKSDADFEAAYQSMLAGYEKLNYQSVIDKYNERMKVMQEELKKLQ